jgi:Flp pilus assembly protein TadG
MTHRRLMCIWRERRANVALMAGLLMPIFLGAAGLGVEASNWSVIEVQLQRAADAAAIGASVAYGATPNAQAAANAAADIAELNGLPAGTRHWTSSTKTLTDGLITAKLVTGVRSASDTAFQVTLGEAVPLAFAKLFVSATSYTLPASATAELVPTASAQPCVLSLGSGSGSTTLTGTAAMTASSCSVRSDGGVTMTGNASITAAAVYAGGNISTSGTAAIHATKFPNDGTIPDPYANYSPLQNAIARLGSCPACAAVSVTSSNQTIGPGSYSSISVSGNSTLTLSAGLYIVNGDISVSGGGLDASAGVTIITSGHVALSGSAQTTLTAPGTTPTGGAISGVAIAGTTTGSVAMTGSSSLIVNGVVYFPKTGVSFTGTWGNQSSPCLELIANTVTLSGTSNLASGGCASYGAKSFGSVSTTTATLVQ